MLKYINLRCARRWVCSLLGLIMTIIFAIIWSQPPLPPLPISPIRHLPVHYLAHRVEYSEKYMRSGCVNLPSLREINEAGPFWQSIVSPDTTTTPQPESTKSQTEFAQKLGKSVGTGTTPRSANDSQEVLIFAAYWDVRNKPRVVLIAQSESAPPPLRCYLWYYNRGDPLTVNATVVKQHDHDGSLRIVKCQPPFHSPVVQRSALSSPEPPAAVSLSTFDFQCGMLHNLVKVQITDPTTVIGGPDSVAVCAVWRRQGDAAVRFLEWLTFLQHFKVQKIYLYLASAHNNVLQVLEHFSMLTPLIETTPYLSPSRSVLYPRPFSKNSEDAEFSDYEYEERNDPVMDLQMTLRAGDLLPYNDCLYRSIGVHNWVVMLDLDEIILPIRDGSWPALAHQESRNALEEGRYPPDVIALDHYWFPAMLQRDMVTPAPSRPSQVLPPPRGRFFEYTFRAPMPRATERVTGKLLSVSRIIRVGAKKLTCESDCTTWKVDNHVARVHEYTARCGGRRERVCRALSPSAVSDITTHHWGKLAYAVRRTGHKMTLKAHPRQANDDD